MTHPGVGNAERMAKHVRHIVTKNICELGFRAITLLSMKASKKKFKRKRDPSMPFGELVQRLWQPKSKELEPKVARANKNKSSGIHERIRKK